MLEVLFFICHIHRVTESQSHWVWKGPLEINESTPTPTPTKACSVQKLAQKVCRLVLSISMVRLHNLLRHPVPLLCHPCSKVVSHVRMEHLMFQLLPIVCHPGAGCG